METYIKVILIVLMAVGIAAVGYLIFRPGGRKPPGPPTPSSCNTDAMRVLQQTASAKILNVPARHMAGWGEYGDNEVGYCGESAAQQAMIYYGNYISQFQFNKAAGTTFLPGVNADKALRFLQAEIDDYGGDSTWQDIFAWMKKQIDNNYPIVGGLYVLEEEGDADYDHICVMYGYELDDKGNFKTIIYNDAYQIQNVTMNCKINKKGVPACFKKREEFEESGENASAALLPCAIPNMGGKTNPDGSPASIQFISIQGNVDVYNELYPVLLKLDNPYEANWGSEDQIFAPPIPISCTVHISCLTPGQNYSLVRFDNPLDLPEDGGNFLDNNSWTLRIDFTATSDTYSVKVNNDMSYPFLSNGTYFFRCVKNTNNLQSLYPLGTNATDTSPDFAVPDDSATVRTRVTKPPRLVGTIQKRLKPRRRKNKKKKTLKKPPVRRVGADFDECQNEQPTGDNQIVCGDVDDGAQIAQFWNWHFPKPFPNFPNAPNPGCIELTFTPTAKDPDEYVSCMKFTIETVNPDDSEAFSPNDDNDGFIGTDNRMYIGSDDLQQYMAFSVDTAASDGSFTMTSADGVTISKLVPVVGDSSKARLARSKKPNKKGKC